MSVGTAQFYSERKCLLEFVYIRTGSTDTISSLRLRGAKYSNRDERPTDHSDFGNGTRSLDGNEPMEANARTSRSTEPRYS